VPCPRHAQRPGARDEGGSGDDGGDAAYRLRSARSPRCQQATDLGGPEHDGALAQGGGAAAGIAGGGASLRGFAPEHWTRIYSSTSLQGLNKEIKRRTNVGGIFPDVGSVEWLVGAMLIDTHDEWQVDRRYFSQVCSVPPNRTLFQPPRGGVADGWTRSACHGRSSWAGVR
jgi:hypothetical protein